jgi:hypothetical protein
LSSSLFYHNCPIFPILEPHLIFDVHPDTIHANDIFKELMLLKTFQKNGTNLIGCRNEFIPFFIVKDLSLAKVEGRKYVRMAVGEEMFSA